MTDLPSIRRENLKRIRDARFTSTAELARAVERSPQQVNDMLNGTKSFGPRIARDFEEKLKLPRGLLDEPIELSQVTAKRTKRIPLLSYVQAGLMTDLGQCSYDEWLEVDDSMPDTSYALRIEGASMEPLFQAGEIVIINTELAPHPGDYVVARLAECSEGETTLKQYAVVGLDKFGRDIFELRSLNPLFPTFSSRELKIDVLGVVVESRKKFR